ncbi:MAG: helix-turn-helix transcriptional regulator [Eubacterium sp.]|jgi:transcriptional regulator, XRE family|nr:helix-turn-helix transcriptional regulator [Eubacterium sp.]HBE09016.1 transcriptional regulator [Lachnospiraceae bacterium]
MKYSRVKGLREDADMNQTDFARILGMSQTGYSKYETGENDIPTAILIELADYYDTSVDYILGLTNEKKPYPRGNIDMVNSD